MTVIPLFYGCETRPGASSTPRRVDEKEADANSSWLCGDDAIVVFVGTSYPPQVLLAFPESRTPETTQM